MDLLKRSLAPLSDAAWNAIDEDAKVILRSQLTARRFVDVDGPKGWTHAAEPLGRLSVLSDPEKDDIGYGLHSVLPLAEIRSPFELSIWDMDNIERGAKDVDFDPLLKAAQKFAAFEERAVYYGFEKIMVQGLKAVSAHKPFSYPQKERDLTRAIEDAVSAMLYESISGPYSLVMGPDKWRDISAYSNGYPIKKHVQNILGGDLIMCPNISEMFLVSNRGGDFKLTLGSDAAIGYESHNTISIRLFLTESFTFQVLEPKAVAVFE
jgi:uncharacterized linocin/CFP29 family protein